MSKVLIDTWWNVNKIKAKVFEEGKAVLIDTWWNVNINFSGKMAQMSTRFNRYMVECELLSEFVNFYSNYVLIDTWWNVNSQ